jgi:hypothetical protein
MKYYKGLKSPTKTSKQGSFYNINHVTLTISKELEIIWGL